MGLRLKDIGGFHLLDRNKIIICGFDIINLNDSNKKKMKPVETVVENEKEQH